MTERLVVIGADAAGLAAASQARRRRGPDDLAITVFERSGWMSYSACGLPYHVSGDVAEIDSLLARSPEQFARDAIDVRLHHTVTGIDIEARTVTAVRNDGSVHVEPWDQLVIATGADARLPDVPGVGLAGVHHLRTPDDALAVAEAAADATSAVVVGGGFIGVEATEALVNRGLDVTLVHRHDRPLDRLLSPGMAQSVIDELKRAGVDLRLGAHVDEVIERGGRAAGVVVDGERVDADLTLVAAGARPAVGFATGIPLGPTGAIAVDDRQRTGIPGVWAAGDCAEALHRVSGTPYNSQLATVAVKQGRVAGINIGGGDARFPGGLRTVVTRVFTREVAATGLDLDQATAAGIAATEGRVQATTITGYMPGAEDLLLSVTADADGIVIGGRIVGGPGSGKRIDTIAMAVWTRMHAAELAMVDLAYAPPVATTWDPVHIAARRAVGEG